MAPRNILYVFGRFNVISGASDKRNFVLQGLKHNKTVEKNGFLWRFVGVDILTIAQDEFASGWLVKYNPDAQEEILESDTSSFNVETIENLVVGKSRFFLHINTGIIIFHSVSNVIRESTFRSRFCDVFVEEYQGVLVDAEVQLLQESFQFDYAFKNMTIINKWSLYLHPSNPSSRRVWKEVDEHLKSMNASSYKEEVKSADEENGLNIRDDEHIQSKIKMAQDGYGKASVQGNIDGRNISISTNDNPITERVSGDDMDSYSLLETLYGSFMRVVRRMKDEN